jgi:hypothetical protein
VLGQGTVIPQPVLIAAIWQYARYDEKAPLKELAPAIEQLRPELLAYFTAAIKKAPEIVEGEFRFIREFNAAEARAKAVANNSRGDVENKGRITKGLVYTGIGITVAALQAAPIVGQVIGAAVALVAAFYEILNAAGVGKVDPRRAEEHILPGKEGYGWYRGLQIVPGAGIPAIDEDPVASLLPLVNRGAEYAFAPTLEEFRAIATEMGLYKLPAPKEDPNPLPQLSPGPLPEGVPEDAALRAGAALIYEDQNYGGKVFVLPSGDYRWVEDVGIPNDSVSSVRAPPGLTLQVFEDVDYSGRTREIRGQLAYLGDDWSDRVSSIRVVREVDPVRGGL